MKTTRVLVVLFFGMLVNASLFAQVDFYLIEKRAEYTQTSSSAPTLTNYQFGPEVNGKQPGTGIPTANPFISSYAGGGGTATMTYDSGEDRWRDHVNFGTNKTAMDTAFNNGTYQLTVGGTPVNLQLGGTGNVDLYPGQTPQVTGMDNGAFWNGSNQLVINSAGTTTLTFNSFSLYNSLLNGQVGGHIGADLTLSGAGTFIEISNEAFSVGGSGDPAFNTFVISGLEAGRTYAFEIEYNVLTDFNSSAISGGTGVGVFTNKTFIDIVTPIPEPSTYAAIFGAVVLAGVMIHRRRRAVA